MQGGFGAEENRRHHGCSRARGDLAGGRQGHTQVLEDHVTRRRGALLGARAYPCGNRQQALENFRTEEEPIVQEGTKWARTGQKKPPASRGRVRGGPYDPEGESRCRGKSSRTLDQRLPRAERQDGNLSRGDDCHEKRKPFLFGEDSRILRPNTIGDFVQDQRQARTGAETDALVEAPSAQKLGLVAHFVASSTRSAHVPSVGVSGPWRPLSAWTGRVQKQFKGADWRAIR